MHSTFVRSLLLVAVVAAVGCTQSTASIAELLVDPPSATINMGQSQPFTATAEYVEGDAVDVTEQVTWTSSDEEVATIDESGLATPVGGGATTITALFGDHQASAELTVEQEPVLVSCVVEPSSVTLTIGGTEQLAVTGHYDDGSTRDVTESAAFESFDPSFVTLDSGGEVEGVRAGVSYIEASIDDVTCTAATITVIDEPCTELTVTADSDAVFVGHSFQLTATCAFGVDAIDVTSQVEWASSDDEIATVDAEGVVTGVSVGDAGLTAIYTNSDESIVEGDYEVSVTACDLEGPAVSPVLVTLTAPGEIRAYTATCLNCDGSSFDCTTDVLWVSSDETVATISNGAGTEGFATSVGDGVTEITAEMDGLTSNVAVLTFEAVCVSIAITPVDPTMSIGLVVDFTATCSMSDGTVVVDPAGLIWVSATPAVASIDSNGEAEGLTVGTTDITASIEGESGPVVSGASVLTVADVALLGIEVSPDSLILPMGVAGNLVATIIFGDGTLDGTAVGTWSSDDPTIATVSNAAGTEGEVTGVAAGTTGISVSWAGVVGTATVIVTEAICESIAVTPVDPMIPAGFPIEFTATCAMSDGSVIVDPVGVTWTSSEPTVATIDADGLATTLSAGTTEIVASFALGTGVITSMPVALSVDDALCISLFVSPSLPFTTAPGCIVPTPLTATCNYSDGTSSDVTALATWTSDRPDVASVSTTGTRGVVTGISMGSTVVAAEYGSVSSNSVTVIVTSPPMMGITVEPDAPADLAVGLTQPFIAWVHWSGGCPPLSEWTNMVVWESSDPTVATISNAPGTMGVATAVGVGTTEITAGDPWVTSPPVVLTVIP